MWMKNYRYYLLTLAVIALDQTVKLLIHFNLQLGGEIPIFGDWFKLHYTRNEGMAFGITLGWKYGKLTLSVFRLIAMFGIAWYLQVLARRGMRPGLLWCTALILGGAMGNVIDSTLYGALLGLTSTNAPTPWFHGEVIDMFYLDMWQGVVPEWVPFFGGEFTSLWPIFNVADASIFVGVTLILIFQKRYFAEKGTPEVPVAATPHPSTELAPEGSLPPPETRV